MPANADHITSIGDVLSSSAVEGSIRVKIGDSISGDGFAEALAWGTPGFYGRPADPTPQGAAQVWYTATGNQKRALGFRDRRAQAILPQIAPGESIMYGQQGQFVRTRNDGSVIAYTTDDNTPNGRGIYAKVAPDGIDLATPWARVMIGPLGVDAIHHSSGATFTMGSVAGLPEPLGSLAAAAGITSYASLDAGMINIKAALLSLGTDGGVNNQAAVTALGLLLLQIIDGIAAITAGSTNGGAAALTSVGLNPAAITALHVGLAATLSPIGKFG